MMHLLIKTLKVVAELHDCSSDQAGQFLVPFSSRIFIKGNIDSAA